MKDKIKKFFIENKIPIIIILSIVLILIFILIFYFKFISNSETYDVDEIDLFYKELSKKDQDIYNSLNVKEVKKKTLGIDISSWQGDIDFAKVKNSGIDFIMIRCGFRNLSNDEIHEDSKFKYNIKEANRYEIPVGVYFYGTSINEKEALEEASYVLNLIKDYDVIYPVVYDFEVFNEKRTKGVDDETINNNALRFLSYIEEHGYKGMLYTNYTALTYHWNLELFNPYKLWYAHYVDNYSYEGVYDMWQYANNGRIDGIVGNVDLNESYISYEIIDE